jgi:hypothetical protein
VDNFLKMWVAVVKLVNFVQNRFKSHGSGKKTRCVSRFLAELRRGMIEKSLNPFRISLGNRQVYTTFAIELKTLR